MSDVLKSHYVKTRKEHECVWCGELVMKGENALYQAYVTDDRSSVEGSYWHKECESACNETDWLFFYENIVPYPGCHKRGVPINWGTY